MTVLERSAAKEYADAVFHHVEEMDVLTLTQWNTLYELLQETFLAGVTFSKQEILQKWGLEQ